MKQLIGRIALFAAVTWSCTAFAQSSQQLHASLELRDDDTPTTFALYKNIDMSVPWTAIELDNGGGAIGFGANVRYIASQNYYVDVTPGNFGNWYLCVYTNNESVQRGFNAGNYSNLFLHDGSNQSCVWKYRNSAVNGVEIRAIRTPLPIEDWDGDPAVYNYFTNMVPPSSAIDIAPEDLDFASLVNFKTVWDYNNLIAMTFAIDMSTVIRQGEYTANLIFEVYYE